MHAASNSGRGKILRKMGLRRRRWIGGQLAILGGLAILLIFAGDAAYGQETAGKEKSEAGAAQETAPSTTNPAKETEIRRLLELTGAKKNAAEFGQQLGEYLKNMIEKSLPNGEHKQQIGDSLVNTLTAHLNSDELIVRLIPIYDREFTADELQGIIQFYESAAGRRLLEATPKVMEEANNVSQQWIRELIPQIMGQMVNQFPELQQGGK